MAEQAGKQKQDELTIAEVVIAIQKWWRFLLSKWVIIVIAGLFGSFLGLVYTLLKEPVYTAASTFVLEEEGGGGGLSSFAGLASIVGVDPSSMGGTNSLFKGDNIFELYRSRRMIEKTLLTAVEFAPGNRALLIDRYLKVKGLRDDWKDDPVLSHLNFNISREQYTTVHDSVITEIVDHINESDLGVEKPDKKLSIIQISLESPDPVFAKEFINHLVENVNAFYVQTKTKKSSQNVKTLQRQADSVKAILGLQIGNTAAAEEADPNANEVLKTLTVTAQKRQIDAEASAAIYEDIVKNLQLAKIAYSKDQPLIQEIDRPVLPLKKNKARKLYYMPGFGILVALMVILFLVVRKIWQDEIKAAG